MNNTDHNDPFPHETPQTAANAHALNSQSAITAVLGAFEQHMREEGFAVNTVKSFVSDVRLLAKYIGAGQPIGEVGTADLNKFLNWLLYERGVPCSPKSYSRRVTTLKVLFSWLQESGVLPLNPADAVVQMSVTSPLPSIPTDEQINQAIAVAQAWQNGETITGTPRKKDARPYLLLSLLLQTAVKKSEAMSIALNHIEEDEQNPQIFIRYKNPRWRYKERKLAIDPNWLNVLEQYLSEYDIKNELFTCTPRNLEYVLRDVGDEAGLERGLISFENMRWVSALTDLKNKMDPDLIREKLGLSKITWRETKSKLERLWEKQKIAAEEASANQD